MNSMRPPSPLRAYWSVLLDDSHPLVRLYWLKDLLELIVRWAVALCLAERRALNGGELPPGLRAQVGPLIERPTLGQWRALLALLTEPPLSSETLEGLARVREQVDLACPAEGDIHTSLIALRNLLAHGGGISPSAARDLLAQHLPRIERLLQAMDDLPCVVIAAQGGTITQLCGPDEELREPPPSTSTHEEAAWEHVWLWSQGGWVGLSPLIEFTPPSLVHGDGALKELSPLPCVQVFMRAERHRLFFSPIGTDVPVSHSLSSQLLRERYGLRQRPQHSREQQNADFMEEAIAQSELLKGREEERERLWEWLSEQRPWSLQQRHLAWVAAGPGMGKSMLMSHLALRFYRTHQLDSGGASKRALYLHRFRGGDARNSTRAFLLGLIGSFAEWQPTRHACPKGWESLDIKELERLLRDVCAALNALRPERAEALASAVPLFCVIADGLDEVVGHNPEVTRVLTELAGPVVVVIAAGRREHMLDELMTRAGAETPLVGGLGPMSAVDIRAMLISGVSGTRDRTRLIAQDSWSEGGEGGEGAYVKNAFIDSVVQRACGMPLYVRLVLEELSSGSISIDDGSSLPASLQSYYAKLISNLGLSTVQRDLPFVITAVATSAEPLSEGALASLLALPWEEDAPRFLERARAALRVGASMLRSVPTPEGELGWSLYHQSLREFIIGREAGEGVEELPSCAELRETLEEVRRRLWRGSTEWEALGRGALGRHLQRWGTEYLLWWAPEGATRAMRRLMTPGLLLERFALADAPELADILSEYVVVDQALNKGEQTEFLHYSQFFRTRSHALRRPSPLTTPLQRFVQLALEHADESGLTRGLEALAPPRPTALAAPRHRAVYESPILAVIDEEPYGKQDIDVKADGPWLVITTSSATRVWDTLTGEVWLEIPAVAKLIAPRRLLAGQDLWDIEQQKVIAHGDFFMPDRFEPPLDTRAFGVAEALLRYTDQALYVVDALTGFNALEIKGSFSQRNGIIVGEGYAVIGGYQKSFSIWDIERRALVATLDESLSRGSFFAIRPHSSGDVLIGRGHKHSAALMCLSLENYKISSQVDLKTEGELYTLGDWLLVVHSRPQLYGRVLTLLKEDSLEVYETLDEPTREKLWTPYHFALGAGYVICSHTHVAYFSSEGLRCWELPEPLSDSALLPSSQNCLYALSCVLILMSETICILDPRDGGLQIINYPESVRDHYLYQRGEWVDFLGNELYCFSFSSKKLYLYPLVSLSVNRRKNILHIGDTLISEPEDGVCFWNIHTGEYSVHPFHEHIAQFTPLDDHRALSWAEKDSFLGIWDTQQHRLLFRLEGHTKGLLGVQPLLNGKRALTWAEDKTIRLWDTESGELLETHQGPGCVLRSYDHLEWLEDHRFLTFGEDGTVRCWEASGEARAVLQGLLSVDSHLVLPDSTLLTWCGRRFENIDMRLIRWSLTPNLHTLSEETSRSALINVSKLGDERLIAWRQDHSAQIYNARGEEVGAPYVHPSPVDEVVVFSPNRAVVSSRDARVITLLELSAEGVSELTRLKLKGNGKPMELKRSAERVVQAQVGSAVLAWSVEEGEAIAPIQQAPRSRVTFNTNNHHSEWEKAPWSPKRDMSRLVNYLSLEQQNSALDGQWVISKLRDEELLVWNTETYEVRFEGKPLEALQLAPAELEVWLAEHQPHATFKGVMAIAHKNGLTIRTADGAQREWVSVAPCKLHVLTPSWGAVSIGAELRIISWE